MLMESDFGLWVEPLLENDYKKAEEYVKEYVRSMNTSFSIISFFSVANIIIIILFYCNVFSDIRNFVYSNNIISYILQSISNLSTLFGLLYVFKFISDFIYILNFHELVDIYLYNLNLLDISNTKVIGILAGIVLFIYFFEYIKNQALFIEQDTSVQGQWFLTIRDLYTYFGLAIMIIMSLFLIRQLKIIELLTLLIWYWIFTKYLVNLGLKTVSILYNYNCLHILNTERKIEWKAEPQYNFITNVFFIKIIIKYINIILDTVIIMWDEGLKQLTLRNNTNIKSLGTQIYIIMFSLIYIYIAYIFYFNIITLFLIEAMFVIWYFQVCLTKYIPNSKVDVTLNNPEQTIIHRAFAVQDFPSRDYVEIITEYTKENEQIKLLKSAILSMYYIVHK